jgi:hypothetical protein
MMLLLFIERPVDLLSSWQFKFEDTEVVTDKKRALAILQVSCVQLCFQKNTFLSTVNITRIWTYFIYIRFN